MEPSGVNRAHACTRTSYSTALQAKRPPTKAREPGSVRLEPRKTGSNEGKPAAQTVRVSFLNKKKIVRVWLRALPQLSLPQFNGQEFKHQFTYVQ